MELCLDLGQFGGSFFEPALQGSLFIGENLQLSLELGDYGLVGLLLHFFSLSYLLFKLLDLLVVLNFQIAPHLIILCLMLRLELACDLLMIRFKFVDLANGFLRIAQ